MGEAGRRLRLFDGTASRAEEALFVAQGTCIRPSCASCVGLVSVPCLKRDKSETRGRCRSAWCQLRRVGGHQEIAVPILLIEDDRVLADAVREHATATHYGVHRMRRINPLARQADLHSADCAPRLCCSFSRVLGQERHLEADAGSADPAAQEAATRRHHAPGLGSNAPVNSP